jgi:hypothetical protein
MDIEHDDKEELIKILEKDSLFLKENHLMDYSLLFIKIMKDNQQNFSLINMPAIIYKKEEDGTNTLMIKEIDKNQNDKADITEEFKEDSLK